MATLLVSHQLNARFGARIADAVARGGISAGLIVLPPDPFGMTGHTINLIGIGVSVALLIVEHLRRRAAAPRIA